MSEARAVADRFVEVVHRHRDARAGELEHSKVDGLAIVAIKHQPQGAGAGDQRVGRLVLVAKGVAADHDRVGPAGIRRGTLWMTIGSRKTTPPRMLRIVPLGDFHIFRRLNSSTRASSGVMVAHLTATPYCWWHWRVDGDLVFRWRRGFRPRGLIILEVDVG